MLILYKPLKVIFIFFQQHTNTLFLAAMMTTSSVASENKLGIMTTPRFQWQIHSLIKFYVNQVSRLSTFPRLHAHQFPAFITFMLG